MRFLFLLLLSTVYSMAYSANFYPIVDCTVGNGSIMDPPAKTDGTFYQTGEECLQAAQLPAGHTIDTIVTTAWNYGTLKYYINGVLTYNPGWSVVTASECPAGTTRNTTTYACESPPNCQIASGTRYDLNGSGSIPPDTTCYNECNFNVSTAVGLPADNIWSGTYITDGTACQPPLPGTGGSTTPTGSPSAPPPATSCSTDQILVSGTCYPVCPYNSSIPAVDVTCTDPATGGTGTGGTGGTGTGGTGTGTSPTTTSSEVTTGDAAIVEAINNLRSEEQIREGRLDSALAETDGSGLLIPKETYDFAGAFSTVTFNSSAVCPSPITFAMMGTTYTLSFEPLCEIMIIMRPLVIAMGMFSAFFIFLGGFKI